MWTGLDPPSVAGMPSSPSPTTPGLIVAFVAACVLSLAATPARASTVSCGDTITTNTTLHHDLTDCAGSGLVIGRDNIRVNLNGHTVDGNDADDACPGDTSCDVGVNNAAGHRGVTVAGGAIREFDVGVLAVDANDNVLRELATSRNSVGILLEHSTAGHIVNSSATDNRYLGMLLLHSSDHNEIRNNRVSGSVLTPGMLLDDSDHNRVEKNVLDGNDQGIASSGGADYNDFVRNRVSHNLGSAISADYGTGNRVTENLITDNGDGITVGFARQTEISGNIVKRSGTFGAPDTRGFGIVLDGSDDDTVDGNVVVGGRGPAIFVTSLDNPETSDRNVISRNVANSTLYDGILVNADATGTLIRRNTANGSARDGIKVEANDTTLIRNTANRNHDLGIEAVLGVTDGGGNRAFWNGNPLQCTNVACGRR
jgi:parallel beta-helix repeat protein